MSPPPKHKRRRGKLKLVIDTMAVVRGARALRQQPPEPVTPELRLILSWIEDEDSFEWLYSQDILDEYREVLRRLKVPRAVVGRLVNLLAAAATEVIVKDLQRYSPDPQDDAFYHCAIDGGADYIVTDNIRDFPSNEKRKRPQIITPAKAVELVFRDV